MGLEISGIRTCPEISEISEMSRIRRCQERRKQAQRGTLFLEKMLVCGHLGQLLSESRNFLAEAVFRGVLGTFEFQKFLVPCPAARFVRGLFAVQVLFRLVEIRFGQRRRPTLFFTLALQAGPLFPARGLVQAQLLNRSDRWQWATGNEQ
jgi:hypothetical protein